MLSFGVVLQVFMDQFWGMQANCLRFIKFIAAKMDFETCRNLGIANDFMVIAQIVGKFWNMNQPMSHYLQIVGKF